MLLGIYEQALPALAEMGGICTTQICWWTIRA
jgi:hypothetical protein